MDLSSNTVLITGGATGIGLAMAAHFLKAGSQVVICGRRREKLEQAQAQYPALRTRVCNVAREKERLALFDWVTKEYPDLNVLINNAGIQRRVVLAEPEAWADTQEELAINLEAPIHLCRLFIPFLKQQKRPAIVNVTSGLAFSPLVRTPVYSATKAALHSFTLSLRHQLKSSGIQVIEIIPPAVDTDLGGVGLHTFGVPLQEFADGVMARLAKGDTEIPYGLSEKSSQASRSELDALFQRVNES